MEFEKLDPLTRLAIGLRYFEEWADADPVDFYMHYQEHEESPFLQPDELKHRVVYFDDEGDAVEEWGWQRVLEGQDPITALTIYFLDDLLAHDRDELVAQVKDFAGGIDWLARLYGVVQSQVNGPIWHDDGTVGTKFDDAKVLEQLRPMCFYFDTISKLKEQPNNPPGVALSHEAITFNLPGGQRKLLAAMLQKRFGGSFDELRQVDVWSSAGRPTDSTIASRLKDLRRKITRFQYWFKINNDQTWQWEKRPAIQNKEVT